MEQLGIPHTAFLPEVESHNTPASFIYAKTPAQRAWHKETLWEQVI
jgi:hypothetical protein